MPANHTNHTIGQLALKLGVQHHQLDRLIRKGKILCEIAGRFRFIHESNVPTVVEALRKAGYIAEAAGAK